MQGRGFTYVLRQYGSCSHGVKSDWQLGVPKPQRVRFVTVFIVGDCNENRTIPSGTVIFAHPRFQNMLYPTM